jgi:hypothetical protein
MPSEDTLKWAAKALPNFDPAVAPAPHRLPGAGSDRKLFRLFLPAGTIVLVEHPLPTEEQPNENDSFVYLSSHLRSHSLPAARVHAYSRELGAYLMDDLDDDDLFGKVKIGLSEGELQALYRDGVSLLARMQVDAVGGLDTSRLHSPPRYDRELMLRWESGYFRRELLEDLLGVPPSGPGLEEEFGNLADGAAAAGADFFLHRDFQSRNLKHYAGELWIIDFQGARLGPAQYDFASFLLDPYVELPGELREELTALYLEKFLGRSGVDREHFLATLPYVAAHRLMQALGAYAFLGGKKGKGDFLQFITPAFRLLREAHGTLPSGRFPLLDRIIGQAQDRWEEVRETS